MFYVPLYIEGLRSRPLLVFWLAALTQAVLWVAVPMLFYAAPPGDVPELLALGREFPLDGRFGPPLAYWLAAIAFRVAGVFGIYVLSQLCVVATYWAIFALGSAIVGPAHAALAVLLMVGIAVFTVPTPEFGPPMLAMAFWALTLLYYWRAVGEGRRRAWYGLGCAAALLLLTTDAALILLAPLALFTFATARGRAAIGGTEPWLVAVGLLVVLFAHVLWLETVEDGLADALARLRYSSAAEANTVAWLRLLAALVIAHVGLAILVLLARGWPRSQAGPAPAIARSPVDPLAATFVKVFALVPGVLATAYAVLVGSRMPVGGAAPLLVLSGLAVVLLAGDSLELHHQRVLGFAWSGLLFAPALFVPALIVLLPWTTGTELNVAQPARAMGRFFAESFERRTGHPLAVVSGDTRLATLIALAAPTHPSVYFDGDPERSPRVTAEDIRQKGAVVVWPAADTEPTPPPDIKTYFPDLVAEVPQTFERPVRGRLPPLRIGWGMIRPANAPQPGPAQP
jgi:hypothetical protein